MKWLASGSVVAVIVVVALAAAAGSRPAAGALSGLDRHFLVAADQANWFEYTAAQMATRRSPTQFGRQLGDIVAADHLQLEARLNAVASRLHLQLARRIAAPDHWELHELGGLSGERFDQRYAQLEMAHVLVGNANAQEELRYGTNAAVQAYARQLLAVLRLHLRLANELSRTSH